MAKFDIKSIQYQSGLIVFFSLCSTCLTLLIYGISARNYDIHDLTIGILVLSLSWYVVNLIDFGMSTFAVQEVVSGRKRIEDFYSIGVFKILCSVGFSTALSAVFYSKLQYLFYGSVIALSLLFIQLISIGLRVTGSTSTPGLIALIEKFSTLLILVLNFNFEWRFEFLQVYMFGVLISLLVALKFSRISIRKVHLHEFPNIYVKSSALGLSALIGQAKLLDVNFLALMIGPVASAPYVLVNRWASSINIFSNAFSQSILPMLSETTLSKSRLDESKKASFWLVLSLVFSVILFLASPLIIEIILGGKFSESVLILRVLSLATILTTLIQPLTVFVQTQSKASLVTLSLLSGFATQILIIFLLSDSKGAGSAAFGYFCGQLISFCFLLRFALKVKNYFG